MLKLVQYYLSRTLLIITFLFNSNVYLQSTQIAFNKLTTRNGLPDNIVLKIIQGPKGFIWIATANGLVRFDGLETKVYQHMPGDSLSLPNNIIRDIVMVNDNLMLIATANGLVKFYPETESFFDIHLLNQFKHYRNSFQKLYLDSSKRIWAFTQNAYLVLNPVKDSMLFYLNHLNYKDEGWPESNPDFQTEDVEGNLWFSKGDYGFFKVDVNNEKINIKRFTGDFIPGLKFKGSTEIVYSDKKGNLYFSNNGLFMKKAGEKNIFHVDLFEGEEPKNELDFRIVDIGEDGYGNIWVSTYNHGIKKYNPRTNKVELVQYTPLNFLGQKGRKVLFDVDNQGFLWLLFDNNVLVKYDHTSDSFHAFAYDPHYTPGIFDKIFSEDFRNKFYTDSRGVNWLAVFGQGVVFFSDDEQKIKSYNHHPINNNSVSSNVVWGLYEDSDKKLWVGALYSGLNIIDQKNNNIHRFLASDNKDFEGFEEIYSFEQIGENTFLLGSVPVKMVRFNKGQLEILKEFRPNINDQNSISDWTAFSILKDNNGHIWFATPTSGVDQYIPSKNMDDEGTFRHFKHNPADSTSISGNDVWFILEDSKGRIWFCTSKGLSLLNEDGRSFTNFLHHPEQTNSISPGSVKHITESSSGDLWIAIEGGGLNKLSFKDGIAVFEKANSLPTDMVYAVFEDDAGLLWLSSKAGILRYNPVNKQLVNFSVNDGLQGREYNAGAFHKGKSGQIYFGGSHGINYFFPDSISLSEYKPKLVFTSLRLFNQEIMPNKEYDGQIIINKAFSYANKVVLKHHQNTFSIDFAALDYESPQNIKYKYRISDNEANWVETNANRRFLNFTNLPPGDYVLSVQSTNSDGVWVNNTRELHIIILPPWWQTWWAMLLFAFVILAILLWAKSIILYRASIKNQLELEQVKTKFFMNLSHEFRTPLTLIIGPANNILERGFNNVQKARQQLELIDRNAKRLMRLVNQLLDLRKLESGKMVFKPAKSSMVKFIKQNFEAFEYLAERNAIQYTFKLKVSNEQAEVLSYFDADIVEKVMYNLLSNAFKYTPKGKTIEVVLDYELSTRQEKNVNSFNGFYIIHVNDTGIGIDEAHLDKIFERFYQVHKAGNDKKMGGTGIGLALTKELVELHKGHIMVSSIPDMGTSFVVKIPDIMLVDKCFEEAVVLDPEIEKYPHISSIHAAPEFKEQQFKHENAPLVLIIDDNPDIRFYLKSELSTEYKIIEAENGKKGLYIAQNEIPDLIICDIMMPEMDGILFVKHLSTHELTDHIPVIFLTAKTSAESTTDGLTAGAIDYITKPFDVAFLKLKVENIIKKKNSLLQKMQAVEKKGVFGSHAKDNPFGSVFYKKLVNIMDEELGNPDLDIAMLCSKMHFSRTQLNRKIKAQFGYTSIEFIKNYRLERAAKMLVENLETNINEVAFSVGFKTQAHFSRAFSEKYLLSPSEFRKKNA